VLATFFVGLTTSMDVVTVNMDIDFTLGKCSWNSDHLQLLLKLCFTTDFVDFSHVVQRIQFTTMS